MAFFHNEKPIIQLFVPEDDTPYYYLMMNYMNIGVHDVILDKGLTTTVIMNYCIIDKLQYQLSHNYSHTQSTNILYNTLRGKCEYEMNNPDPVAGDASPRYPTYITSVSQLLEYTSKLLLSISNNMDTVFKLLKHNDVIDQLKTQVDVMRHEFGLNISVLEEYMYMNVNKLGGESQSWTDIGLPGRYPRMRGGRTEIRSVGIYDTGACGYLIHT